MMKRLVLILLLTLPTYADETGVPATPIAPVQDPIAGYKVTHFEFDTSLDGNSARVFVVVAPYRAGGQCARDTLQACRLVQRTYDGSDASTIINALNTANLTNNSLRKRILNRLIADGVLPAVTVQGAPGIPDIPSPIPTVGP